MHTKKELAEELGVSKSTVYRLLKDNHIKYGRKQGQTMYYDDTVLNRLRSIINQQRQGPKLDQQSGSESDLKRQLEQKDEMIDWLKRQLDEKEKTLQLTIADNHALHLQLSDQLKLAAPKTDKHEQNYMEKENFEKAQNGVPSKKDTKKRRHWWQFFTD